MLIDPLIPAEGREPFLAWLDARLEGRQVSILTTVRWHRRDRDELARRYVPERRGRPGRPLGLAGVERDPPGRQRPSAQGRRGDRLLAPRRRGPGPGRQPARGRRGAPGGVPGQLAGGRQRGQAGPCDPARGPARAPARAGPRLPRRAGPAGRPAGARARRRRGRIGEAGVALGRSPGRGKDRPVGGVRISVGPRARYLPLVAVLGAVLGGLPALATSAGSTPTINGLESKMWSPKEVTIGTGGSVTFKNASSTVMHSLKWLSGPEKPACTGTPESGQTNWEGSCTFSAAGTYDFFCTVHAGMTGTVVVSSSGTTTTTTTGTTTTTATTGHDHRKRPRRAPPAPPRIPAPRKARAAARGRSAPPARRARRAVPTCRCRERRWRSQACSTARACTGRCWCPPGGRGWWSSCWPPRVRSQRPARRRRWAASPGPIFTPAGWPSRSRSTRAPSASCTGTAG